MVDRYEHTYYYRKVTNNDKGEIMFVIKTMRVAIAASTSVALGLFNINLFASTSIYTIYLVLLFKYLNFYSTFIFIKKCYNL